MSPEAATSRAKSHVACSGLVTLVVEGRNILCVRKLCCAQSSPPEVKNERVERFACESFYPLLLVLSALLLLSPFLIFAAALELFFLSFLWSSV